MLPSIDATIGYAVLGADCCGRVAAVGGDIDTEAPPVGTRVVVDPGVLWGDKAGYPSNMYHILGMAPAGGTLAQYVAVDASQVHECPKHLSSAEAAALPLAGLTAYRATFMKGQVKAGKHVLVSGIGGGVATFALQYAVAAGATVWVTSSSPSKIKAAKELGAKGGVLYTEPQWHKRVVEEAGGPFDAVIDGAGGDNVNSYVKLLRNGGIIAMYGSTTSAIAKVNLARLFLKNVELRGSTMGSPGEFKAMLAFVAKHKLRPAVHKVVPFARAQAAFDIMRDSRQFGKIVIEAPSGRSVTTSARL